MLGLDAQLVADPDPGRPEITVRVFLRRSDGPEPLAELYPEVHRRHTYRGPMGDLPVPPELRDHLTAAVRAERADLVWLARDDVERLLGTVLEAAVLDESDESRRQERARWIGGERAHEGIPGRALGPRPADFPAAFRDLDPNGADRAVADFEPSPVLAVLTTTADGPAEWLDAGIALQRGLLTATSSDLAASFVNQPVEHPEQRRYVRELIGGAGHPQVVIRLGYAAGHLPHAPRRPWRDLIDP
jgi:hypothetical protein